MVQWKSSGIHQTKRHTPLSPTLLTNSNSYYPVEPSANGQLVKVEIPKPFGERFLKNDSAEMRLSSRRYGNCVDRAGPLPFNLHESWTSLNPLDLKFVFRYEQSSVPDESAASPARDSDERPLKVLARTDRRDDYSSSESKDSDSDEEGADDRSGFNKVMSTRVKKKSVHR